MEILFWVTLFGLPSASCAWVLISSFGLDQRSVSLMPPNAVDVVLIDQSVDGGGGKVLRCGILGCGMMGQEHCSYIAGYPQDIRIDFLCDPNEPSLTKCLKTLKDFAPTDREFVPPTLMNSEDELLEHAQDIDLLVIASPNYMHTGSLLRWSQYDITILVEKPVAISQPQIDILRQMDFKARVWVAMEYRFMPAIAKLLEMIPNIGEVKMVTIRENRFPFLLKVGNWNRDLNKTGDSLVEKCCHFFDLMRLITGKECLLSQMQAIAQRGINYHDEPHQADFPIIDAAYVTMPWESLSISDKEYSSRTMSCLELCMYADGSRHQEEVIVTGTKGRLEAYLPENKVYAFQRPSTDLWTDRTVPPPLGAIKCQVWDCSDAAEVHHTDPTVLPKHGGYHYGSTAVEWYKLLNAFRQYEETGIWKPLVSLDDGIRAVEMGLQATRALNYHNCN